MPPARPAIGPLRLDGLVHNSAAWRFHQVSRARRVPIKFVGVWDTVSSMIVPRADRFFVPSLQTLPYTRTNPGIEVFRHAMAIDERRRMFRLNAWVEPDEFKPNPFAKTGAPHDTKQVWFAGAHGDVGGGWPEKQSGLAKIALQWMIDEAKSHGVLMNTAVVNHLVKGHKRKGGRHDYVPPNPFAEINDSMTPGWRILEWLPKHEKWKVWPKRKSWLKYYLPRSEPRFVPNDAILHPAVRERVDELADYKPINLPDQSDMS